MYYNVNHLDLYGIILLNRYDVSRVLNKVSNSKICFYKYSGRYKCWFIHVNYIYIIQKKALK